MSESVNTSQKGVPMTGPMASLLDHVSEKPGVALGGETKPRETSTVLSLWRRDLVTLLPQGVGLGWKVWVKK